MICAAVVLYLVTMGYVYILSNQAFPGLIKIGFSRKEPSLRAGELFTTGVPTPFQVEYFCVVENYSAVEAKVHTKLNKFRNRRDREFFKLSVRAAAQAIESICVPEKIWFRKEQRRDLTIDDSLFPPGHPLRDFYQN